MTICIAAIHSNNTLVMASDRKISFGGLFSSEGAAIKFAPVTKNWVCMVAGEDISPFVPILDRITNGERPITFRSFVDLCCSSYQAEFELSVERSILFRYGYSFNEFKEVAKRKMASEIHHHASEQIARHKFGIKLLFAGFSSDDPYVPHIFTIGRTAGEVEYMERTGFWAIGSGGPMANATLASYDYNRNRSLEDCLYQVAVAKIAAEPADGVGTKSHIGIFRRDANHGIILSDDAVNLIRNHIAEQKRTPPEIANRIKSEVGLMDAMFKIQEGGGE